MNRKIGVVGLGYVGLPLAVAFGKRFPVVGFDLKRERIESLRNGRDLTGEISSEDLAAARIEYTDDPSALRKTDFIIVAVPTPIDSAKRPDLLPLTRASELIGANLRPGAIVVFESTVYPGVTEEICAPIIEKASGLSRGKDFKIGYSPERINPGDKEHTLERIVKVVSGMDAETLDAVAEVYGAVCSAGVYRAASIRTAEAAKVIENTQRDLNIALVNELSMIFHRIGLDTLDVLTAAGTKWNFLPFRPGLVGGHCIGVDPYYLTHRAELAGYHPQVILAGRRINDGMGKYVAEQAVKLLISQGIQVNEARVTLLGLTFKENIPDIRNTRVVDILHELKEYGVSVTVADPHADPREAKEEYGIGLVPMKDLAPADAVILAVPHREFLDGAPGRVRALLRPDHSFIMDVKGVLRREDFPGVTVWRL
jgi:UDP-N-acetyl-D-galactosamine dehydrogenase